MLDLESRARAAGAAARQEARVRARHLVAPGIARHTTSTRTARTRSFWLVGTAVALAVAVVLASGLLRTVRPPVIEPAGGGAEFLETPEVGEATAGYLPDGRPVFVTQPEEGVFLVLDAVSPHLETKLLVFCATSGWLEDIYHGSKFDPWGHYVDGPAPTGLPAYPHEVVATGAGPLLRVTGPAGEAPERRGPRRGPERHPRGPSCDPDVAPSAGLAGPAIVHRPPADLTARDADAIPADRWVWARLRFVPDGPRTHRLCDADGTCPVDAPQPERWTRPDGPTAERMVDALQVGREVYLVRRTAPGTVTVLLPGDPSEGLGAADG